MTYETAAAFFAAYDLTLTREQFDRLEAYRILLLTENEHTNLTAITDATEIWIKHFLDSALLLHYGDIGSCGNLLDVGTGAGFPAIVLAILCPNIEFTLLDSLQKKTHFLDNVIDNLALKHVHTVTGRAEEVARYAKYREKFDGVTARAVAPLPILLEYCLPFVKVNGVFYAMKGPTEDTSSLENVAEMLGGVPLGIIEYRLLNVGERRLIRVGKMSKTGEDYPRRGARIKRMPLG